jgi:NhaP-type Na+/H+ or K+/H+ antiporter
MVRTGFRLDAAGIHGLSKLMVLLAIVPGLLECVCVTSLAYWLLGMPSSFALLLGIILAAACPSVLRPCFSLMGAGRAVHSALIAAACLNDMIVIGAFGVVTAVIFSFEGQCGQPGECHIRKTFC